MTDSFNLADQPWIPCERLDGSVADLSTRDALVEAHAIRAIVDPSPLVQAVLHRHLLAVLHRCYAGPKTVSEWLDIARADRFDSARIESYLGRVKDGMDLFHPKRPFAQARGLVEQFKADPIDELLIERSGWGKARELFQHRPPAYRPMMTPAMAARALLGYQAFATGGLIKKPDEPTSATAAPLVKAAVVLLRGETLFKTLIANLLEYDPANSKPISATTVDAPAWEQDPLPARLPRKREPQRLPRGWLDLLTWVSRRIELVHDGEDVTAFVRAVGQGMAEAAARDPMVAYRVDEKRGPVSVGLEPDRAFWRSATALFTTRDAGKRFLQPASFAHAGKREVVETLGERATYDVDALGLAADKSRVDMARAETLRLRLRLLDDADAGEAVENAIRIAEEGVRALRLGLRVYAEHLLTAAHRAPDAGAATALVASFGAETAAWSELGGSFSKFVGGMQEGIEAAEKDFAAEVGEIVRRQFALATGSAGSAAHALRARAHAETAFRDALTGRTRADHVQGAPSKSSDQEEQQ